ncbi:GNAT family N-acetyltransferase [Neobacillus sp. Marseille-QA0830]
MPDPVRLGFYQPTYKQQMVNYILTDEQTQFTAHPKAALAACEKDDERFPVIIFYHDTPAGFFVLHGWRGVQEYCDNENALLLRAFSVQSSYQGKGIAQHS